VDSSSSSKPVVVSPSTKPEESTLEKAIIHDLKKDDDSSEDSIVAQAAEERRKSSTTQIKYRPGTLNTKIEPAASVPRASITSITAKPIAVAPVEQPKEEYSYSGSWGKDLPENFLVRKSQQIFGAPMSTTGSLTRDQSPHADTVTITPLELEEEHHSTFEQEYHYPSMTHAAAQKQTATLDNSLNNIGFSSPKTLESRLAPIETRKQRPTVVFPNLTSRRLLSLA
jgi:hypothetical protein